MIADNLGSPAHSTHDQVTLPGNSYSLKKKSVKARFTVTRLSEILPFPSFSYSPSFFPTNNSFLTIYSYGYIYKQNIHWSCLSYSLVWTLEHLSTFPMSGLFEASQSYLYEIISFVKDLKYKWPQLECERNSESRENDSQPWHWSHKAITKIPLMFFSGSLCKYTYFYVKWIVFNIAKVKMLPVMCDPEGVRRSHCDRKLGKQQEGCKESSLPPEGFWRPPSFHAAAFFF